MSRRTRTRRTVRPHPYAAASTVPADHRGLRPCICGRALGNAAHAQTATEQVDAAQAEHLRRIGDEL